MDANTTIAHPDLAWARRMMLDAHADATCEELDSLYWSSLMGCYMIEWRGMSLGIETDGYIHS